MINESISLTQKQFDELPEYSCSIPTGTTIGKRWKKNDFAFTRFTDGITRQRWWLCEYYELTPPDPKNVGISYKRIVAVFKPKNKTKFSPQKTI